MKNAFNIEKLEGLTSEELERIAKAVLLALRRQTHREYEAMLDRNENVKHESHRSDLGEAIHAKRSEIARSLVCDIEDMPDRSYHK